jgi:DNA-binding SARP family transcriptional activator/tetratricopeptide (TPR) repeat protein
VGVRVGLLGGFRVDVDGVRVPEEAWSRRHAAQLVKILALSEGHRLHRERVMDALWPGLPVEAAAPRLHKAAHYARRALGERPDAVALRHDMVTLVADHELTVDLDVFLAAARAALAARSRDEAERALELHGGELLPEDPYEPWTTHPRDVVRALHLDLLRLAGRWEELLREEPTDEQAHLALARAYAERGDVRGGLRQLERLEQALRRELGTTPSPTALSLRARLEGHDASDPAAGSAAVHPAPPTLPRKPLRGVRLAGRRDVGDRIRARLDRAGLGRGGTLVLVGAPGVGKSALLDLTTALAEQRGWRTGRGSASAVEGPWPYAPVLEALGDLCRKHPALLDGLDDLYRGEIDRALSGRELSWSGESGHQRLFVATAELVRLAAAGHGLVLAVDDVHDADEASMRLLHYLARSAAQEPVLVAMAHRPDVRPEAAGVLDSLVARDPDARVEVTPLTEDATRRMLADRHPDLTAEATTHIWQVGAGVPFTCLELARALTHGGRGDVVPVLPAEVQQSISRVALLGTTFTTDELLAVSGVDEDEAYHHLDVALSTMLVEPAETGYRFRHPLVREALLRRLPHAAAVAARREVAARLAALGAPPSRVAHQYVAAGLPRRAVPYVVRAVEVAGALGAYRDALSLVDAVRDHAGEDDLPRLLARRGDLLMALGDPEAVTAYRQALPLTTGTEHRLVRARLSRCASLSGDLDTARAALAGLGLEGDAADGPVLLAQGNLAYFTGDVDTAWEVASRARDLLDVTDDAWHVVDLVSLQGLIAHQRGEWFDRFRMELRRTRGKDDLAVTLFDAHLCVAEYLLYGPMPYAEVVAEAEDLRARATRAGALRGIAFATALIGEAALLMGDIDRAEAELEEAVELHRDLAATAGEAHSLQRLAEVRLAQGRRDEATLLLHRALPLARWSQISLHLMQRIYGTMIAAAPDAAAARAVVDQAEASLGETDSCFFCDVMLEVPAATACADVGDLDEARRHLGRAEEVAARWSGTAWQAGVARARAHLARAEGRHDDVARLSHEAARLYDLAGQVADAARCRAEAAGLTATVDA